MKKNLREFQKKIKYEFKDSSLLETALTHSSFIQNTDLPRTACNQRLEYLGDAFLDAIAGEELFHRLPEAGEGQMSKMRAAVVCERSLADIGRRLDVGSLLRMGNGEDQSGGRNRDSIIADSMEAVIGAVYLDSGYDRVKELVLDIFRETIDAAISGRLRIDYKSDLQERIQGSDGASILYRLDSQQGPPHDRTFYVTLLIGMEPKGKGVGRTKKEAEQAAAREALENLN